MFKKTLALLLSVMMLFTMALPASAANSEAKTQENIEAFFSELLGGKVEIGDDFFKAITENLGAAPSKKAVAGAVSQYAVVAAEDVNSVDALAQAIADDSVYTIKTLENGKKTVYIAVNVAEHPELFDMEVFRAAVYKICDKQKEFVASEDDFDLLTYTRFAGELYLHMRIYQIADPMADILGTVFDFLNKIVEMTGIADMNIDESRFPGFLFDIIGAIML